MIDKPKDGQILGLDADGCILQYDADRGEVYNCGETLEEFGPENVFPEEWAEIERAEAARGGARA